MKNSLAYSPNLRRQDSFIHLDELLPELLSHILVSVFHCPDLKKEFPKLFCVCKRWIQILDCPNVHKAIGKYWELLRAIRLCLPLTI